MIKKVSCRRCNALPSVLVAILFIALFGAHGSFAAGPVEARKEIKQMGIEYTEQQFAMSAGAGGMTAVKLFLDAGMDVNSGGGPPLACRQVGGRLQW